ncbi:hypothetical protein [Ferruginibacter sp.]
MKKLSTLIILSVFWALPFGILYMVIQKVGIAPAKYIPGFYSAVLTISVLYKKYWSFNIFNRWRGGIIFSLIFAGSIIAFVYFNTIVYRSYKLFEYLTAEKKRGWEGIAHQTDDTLGFKPVPNAKAFHTFPIGEKIPMAYDQNGFRVPLSDSLKHNIPGKVDLLFLGCSFTYGDACFAEETFCHITAKQKNLTYINAGVCSYGLAHMLILAEKLLPEYRPKYLVVQYSQWLAGRSLNVYAPNYYAYLPTPYFSLIADKYSLEYPAFKTQAFNLDATQIKNQYNNNFLKFLFTKGISFYLKEDWLYQKNKILTLTGSRFKPATNAALAEKFAYNSIKQIADNYGTKIIVLNMGDIEYSKKSHQLFSDNTVYYAEADSALGNYLKLSATKNYSKEFNHWRFNGKDSILVDAHPNLKAHEIIANSIIKQIDKIENKYLKH